MHSWFSSLAATMVAAPLDRHAASDEDSDLMLLGQLLPDSEGNTEQNRLALYQSQGCVGDRVNAVLEDEQRALQYAQ